jgi:adenylate kinase family enzyme
MSLPAQSSGDRFHSPERVSPNAGWAGCLLVRQYALVPDDAFMVIRSVRDIPSGTSVGRRFVVTGRAGAGKSTFSRALSAQTGIPLVHLDVHFWKPGWVEPSEDEWIEKQRGLITSDEWILDGNYHATLELRLERANTAVFLDTPWWVCAWRALVRGVRKRPVGFQLPTGCEESASRRLLEEWSLAWRIVRDHRAERELELGILSRHVNHVALYVLRPEGAARHSRT